ncbi:hypothetical protein [Enterococcus sp. AZ152]|uniref:hypothetical protein n=1 Tax=Enterococcus sp. AZ152 TaxID=2774848 RepID=UPI003F20420C
MKYSQQDHKKMWLEKLENDLSNLESLGYSENSKVYKEAKKRTAKVREELNNLYV